MDSRDSQTLVFIHGVGGAVAQDRWLTPLSNVMAQYGFSRPEQSGINTVTVDYRELLLSPPDAVIPREVWRRPKDSSDAYSEFQVRRARLDLASRTFKELPPTLHLGAVPQGSTEVLARTVESALRSLRAEARVYRTDQRARAAVLTTVRSQIPATGRVVIVAHSLGSVIAADVLKRLPPTVMVDRLITIGSPLPMTKFWPFLTLAGHGFPFDMLRSWANIFDSRDPVAGGRGIGRWYPEAVDIDVHLGSLLAPVASHASEYYLSLPVVGALVGESLFEAVGTSSTRTPSRRLGRAWDLYLLGAAYALQVSTTCEGRKHAWRRRFDAARRASIIKLLAETQDNAESLPESAREIPNELDFLDHAAGLIKGRWSDEALVPFTVALLMSSPVRPFEFPVDDDHGELALTYLLDRVRRGGSNTADPEFAKRVAAALKEAREAMGGRMHIWAYLMLGGAAVLAATGVGIWAAAPAGVAGAALLTSTLAAFGPGGMVGGMITIAAASGAGSALVGAGAMSTSRQENEASASFASSLAKLSKDQLRATVTGLMAVVIAQDKLAFVQTVDQTKTVLTSALTRIVNEENAHRGLGSSGAKAWEDKRKIVERGMLWLEEQYPSVTREATDLALTRPDGSLALDPARLALMVGPNLNTVDGEPSRPSAGALD